MKMDIDSQLETLTIKTGGRNVASPMISRNRDISSFESKSNIILSAECINPSGVEMRQERMQIGVDHNIHTNNLIQENLMDATKSPPVFYKNPGGVRTQAKPTNLLSNVVDARSLRSSYLDGMRKNASTSQGERSVGE
jgi:hypothetical protein